ncbi:hypothetical protein GGR57DRAFT_153908 [Xylariaceae sp. FL1272]|nr:hypothetical protein GGR57DRAFT_153908 [Xylariaceae sp. FL1272]
MATRNLELSIQSVATATGQFERVGRNDERHQLVQVIVEGALQLHERKDCKRSLIQTAREIVIGLRAARHSSLWKLGRRDSNELPEMPDYVDKFLRRIRSDFPTILLDATEGEAFVIREHWAKGDQNATVHSWSSAKVLGVVHLNQHIINCMISCKAKHPDMFHAFMFQMIISTAHEICHLLTSALTGGSDPPKTPERLKLDDSQGEAGFYWELYALGGVTLFFVDPGRPNDIQQAGIPWMLDGKGSKAHGIQVQQAVMNNFVRNMFRFHSTRRALQPFQTLCPETLFSRILWV